MSKKINRHLRSENARLRLALEDALNRLDLEIDRRRDAQEALDNLQEEAAREEVTCERNKARLRHELYTERQAREDLEYDAQRARRAAR